MKSRTGTSGCKEIAAEYAKQPEGTLVVSPDNQSRMEINQIIHREMQTRGQVDHGEHRMRVLIARQEITGRRPAVGRAIRARRRGALREGQQDASASKLENTPASNVSNAKENLLTVEARERRAGQLRSAPPARSDAVPRNRTGFSEGDRVQFTAPNREQHVANRELGTIEKIDESGNLQLRLDSGRDSRIQHQRESASRLRLCGDEPQQPGPDCRPRADPCGHRSRRTKNSSIAVWRMWPCPRGRYDAQIYTNDKDHLAEQLSRDVSHRSAMEPAVNPYQTQDRAVVRTKPSA